MGGARRIHARAHAGVPARLSQSRGEHPPRPAAGVSRHPRSAASAPLWREGDGLHGSLRRRRRRHGSHHRAARAADRGRRRRDISRRSAAARGARAARRSAGLDRGGPCSRGSGRRGAPSTGGDSGDHPPLRRGGARPLPRRPHHRGAAGAAGLSCPLVGPGRAPCALPLRTVLVATPHVHHAGGGLPAFKRVLHELAQSPRFRRRTPPGPHVRGAHGRPPGGGAAGRGAFLPRGGS